MKVITFLTDFGTQNSYVAQMKGVASTLTDARLIDITHDITPHSIQEGAFALLTSVDYYPMGTVHVAVVDPGVGTDRKGILVTTRSQILIGPDNGLLIPAARHLGDFTVYEITNAKYMLNNVSNTFHGRDIFTPVAAHITNGVPFEEIGPVTDEYVNLDFGKCDITDKTATGQIIYVDHFGNIITNVDGKALRKVLNYDSKIMAFIGDKKQKLPFAKSYNYVRKGQMLATIGSSNFLEIDKNQGDASKKLKVKPGDSVKIMF